MTSINKRLLSADPWQFCCPRGHHSLRVNSQTQPERRYVCEACRKGDKQPYYAADDLVDKRKAAREDDGEWNGV